MDPPHFQRFRYILIDSIDELDLKRVNIHDLNKKYMDREGNRFALRFDLETRRIRLVRLAASKEEANRIRSDILKHRRQGRQEDMELYLEPDEAETVFIPPSRPILATASPPPPLEPDQLNEPPAPTRPGTAGLLDIVDSGFFDDFDEPGTQRISEADLFPEIDKEIARITDSQKAIIRALGRSGVLDRFENTDEFYILSKAIDEKCIQAGINAMRLYQELSSFPKSPMHYMQSFPDHLRTEIESLPDDRTKIERIRGYELHRVFGDILKAILEMTVELRRWIEKFPPEEKRKKYYEDLIPSFAEITGRASSLQHRLNEWYRTTVPNRPSL